MALFVALTLLALRPDVKTFSFGGGTPAQMANALHKELDAPVAFGIEDGSKMRAISFEYTSPEEAKKRFLGFHSGLVTQSEDFAVAPRPFPISAFPGLATLRGGGRVFPGPAGPVRGRPIRGGAENEGYPANLNAAPPNRAFAGLAPVALSVDSENRVTAKLAETQYFSGGQLDTLRLRPDWILTNTGYVAAFEKLPQEKARSLVAQALGGVITGDELKVDPKTLSQRISATWRAAAQGAIGLNRAKINVAEQYLRSMRVADLQTFFSDPSSRATFEAAPNSGYYRTLGNAYLAQDAQRPLRARMAPRIDPRAPMTIELTASGSVRVTMRTLQGGSTAF